MVKLFGQSFKLFAGAWKEIYHAMKEELTKKAKKEWKILGKTIAGKKTVKRFAAIGKTIKGIGSAALFPLNMFMSVLDAIGIAEPFLELFSGVLEIVGAAVMEKLMPAFNKLVEVLMSEPMIGFLTDIGHLLGVVLEPIITIFVGVLKGLEPAFDSVKIIIDALTPALELLGPAFEAVGMVIGGIVALPGMALSWITEEATKYADAIADQKAADRQRRREKVAMGLAEYTATGVMPAWAVGTGYAQLIRSAQTTAWEQSALFGGDIAGLGGATAAGIGAAAGQALGITFNIDGNLTQEAADKILEQLQLSGVYNPNF